MITRLRFKVAAGALFGLLSLAGSAEALARSPETVRYTCEGADDLVIQRDASTAHVKFADRSYQLRRKASGIGEKYMAPGAALIIDGDSAVFVADDHLQLGACIEASSIASAR
jgi:membrane-bound inhibitor of C-type lysozyme